MFSSLRNMKELTCLYCSKSVVVACQMNLFLLFKVHVTGATPHRRTEHKSFMFEQIFHLQLAISLHLSL